MRFQPAQIRRGEELEALGFDAWDALHLAAAEDGDACVLLTTDDRLIRQAARTSRRLRLRVVNPLDWLLE